MNTTLLIRARRHFFRPYIPRHVSVHNARQWVRSLRMLGSDWLLAKPVERKQ